MGDRTSVYLTIIKSQKELIEEFISGNFGTESYNTLDVANYPELITYYFEEVNYGELPFLNKLKEFGIAFTSNWESGAEFAGGNQYLRFDEQGDEVGICLYDNALNPQLYSLMQRIDKPAELRQYILDFKKDLEVLPWDNQEEYGKIYRAKQLIGASCAS
jgi:hypothetical protein